MWGRKRKLKEWVGEYRDRLDTCVEDKNKKKEKEKKNENLWWEWIERKEK